MRTKTQIKEAEISREFSLMQKELHKVIRKEFPVGTKVKWLLGKSWQHGVVEESNRYDWSTRLRVRNSKTGKQIQKEAKEFDLDD